MNASWKTSVELGAAGRSHGVAAFAARQWRQVLARDASADGQFFYAVKTTRIYCRPSCPSRRPRLRNVAFFASAAAAEQAGFRPCKRCQPKSKTLRLDVQAPVVQAAVEYLAARPTEKVRLDELAYATGATRLTVLRAFRRVLGVSPREYTRAQRISAFQEAVRPTLPAETAIRQPNAGKKKRITDAIYDAGFGSSSRLYESSAESLGMKPSTLRKGGEGLRIRYTTAGSVLGRVLVASTDVGICAITFARSDTVALAELRKRFPKADIAEDRKPTGWLAGAVDYVLSQLTEHPLAATFPLDVRATAFQQRVWKALQQIPRGETRSYSDVARDLGRASAVRAVAAAIGSNPVALAIPCHRVVGRDGTLTGYRWGLDRKRRLLKAESSSRDRSKATEVVRPESPRLQP